MMDQLNVGITSKYVFFFSSLAPDGGGGSYICKSRNSLRCCRKEGYCYCSPSESLVSIYEIASSQHKRFKIILHISKIYEKTRDGPIASIKKFNDLIPPILLKGSLKSSFFHDEYPSHLFQGTTTSAASSSSSSSSSTIKRQKLPSYKRNRYSFDHPRGRDTDGAKVAETSGFIFPDKIFIYIFGSLYIQRKNLDSLKILKRHCKGQFPLKFSTVNKVAFVDHGVVRHNYTNSEEKGKGGRKKGDRGEKYPLYNSSLSASSGDLFVGRELIETHSADEEGGSMWMQKKNHAYGGGKIICVSACPDGSLYDYIKKTTTTARISAGGQGSQSCCLRMTRLWFWYHLVVYQLLVLFFHRGESHGDAALRNAVVVTHPEAQKHLNAWMSLREQFFSETNKMLLHCIKNLDYRGWEAHSFLRSNLSYGASAEDFYDPPAFPSRCGCYCTDGGKGGCPLPLWRHYSDKVSLIDFDFLGKRTLKIDLFNLNREFREMISFIKEKQQTIFKCTNCSSRAKDLIKFLNLVDKDQKQFVKQQRKARKQY